MRIDATFETPQVPKNMWLMLRVFDACTAVIRKSKLSFGKTFSRRCLERKRKRGRSRGVYIHRAKSAAGSMDVNRRHGRSKFRCTLDTCANLRYAKTYRLPKSFLRPQPPSVEHTPSSTDSY
jgi:hypothetical protein